MSVAWTTRRCGMLAGAAMMLVFALAACSSDAGPMDGDAPDDEPGDEQPDDREPHALEGTWTTTGTDPRYGAATVRLQIEPEGALVVSVALDAGGTLRFAGGWTEADSSLTLTGSYFDPDGEVTVGWSVEGDSVMVLSTATGAQQRWRRQG